MTKMSKSNNLKSAAFFYRPQNKNAARWAKKIEAWLKKNYPAVKLVLKKPQVLIVLGGDGAILEAARKYQKSSKSDGPIIVGLNLGRVGFLASVRSPKKFLAGLDNFFSGKYQITERLMLETVVRRKGKNVFKVNALNDVVLQNLISVSEIEVNIGHHPIQYIRGTGVLVATATGSTAYNLSAHGPIVMPSIKCFIVSELLDHNIPTPSIVVEASEEIKLKITDFRPHGFFSLTKTGKPVDMILSADGSIFFPLKKGDVVLIKQSPYSAKFADLEKNYFFKSLQEKFTFK